MIEPTQKMLCLLFLLVVWGDPLAAAPLADSPMETKSCKIVSGAGEMVPVRKARLAGATRSALDFPVGESISVTCQGEAGVFIASVGVRGLMSDDVAVFRIKVETASGWQSLLEESISGDEGGWIDLRLEFDVADSSARRIILESESRTENKHSARALVGGVRFLPKLNPSEAGPNIILISLDTLGAEYLGYYGGRAEASQGIDAFLRRAFTFRRAYATYPNTLVSHASLFSGLYPTSHGVYGTTRDAHVKVDLISTVLKKRGYFNVAFTENAFVSSDFGFDRDFDWYDDGPERAERSFLGDASETFERSTTWLERYGRDAPFLLFVHTYEVHSPYIVRDDESRSIADAIAPDVEMPEAKESDIEHLHNAGIAPLSDAQVNRMRAVHVGEIHYLDRAFSKFMRRLENMPFADRTLVVVFADHGDEFVADGKIGHGKTLNDKVLHVPLAFYWPGRVKRGDFGRPVSLVDVVPTVLDLIGQPGALSGDGRSLAPLLRGEIPDMDDRPVFAELQRVGRSCLDAGYWEGCVVGRFVVHTDEARFESSTVPPLETLERIGENSKSAIEPTDFHSLLAKYVTGSPWGSSTSWRPRPVEKSLLDGDDRRELDETTKERLGVLGYGRP